MLKTFLQCLGLAAGFLTTSVQAQTYVPYTSDAYTLHLWHLDNLSVPVPDAGTSPVPLAVLGGGATLGNASSGGMGTALGTVGGGAKVAVGTGTQAYLAAATLVDGASDNVNMILADPGTGAFTYEAMVNFSFNPKSNLSVRNAPMEMVCGEQDDTGGGTRIFQFRFDPVGFNPNADGITTALTKPALEFVNIGSGEHEIIYLPTTGSNVPVQGAWYHVAVAYNGAAGVSGNMVYYWTRLDGVQTQPAMLSTQTMASDLATGATDFAVGNTGRTPSENNFVGLIDEVRISAIARAPGEMLPASLGGAAYLPSPPAGFSGAASATNAASLTWSAVPGAVDYVVEESTVSGGPYSNLATVAGTAFTQTGLTSGATYYYVVYAVNAAGGMSAISSEVNVSTYTVPGLRFIPVTDGSDPAATGYAYAGTSGINAIAFICSGLKTVGGQQFMTFYGRHQTNASFASNNTLWVARRAIGSTLWQVFPTAFTPDDITDGHDVVSFGIDGAGYMHISWGMHNATPCHYAKSTLPVTGTNAISFGADLGTLTGNEVEVTYPQFLTTPTGDMFYLYRVGGAGGGSGNGDTFWDYYSQATGTWSNVNVSGTTVVPLIDGISYSYNAYPNLPCIDSAGNLFLAWTWRYTANWQTNENIDFALSTDLGAIWDRSTGSAYTLPLAEHFVSGTTPSTNCVAQQVLAIPQNSSLINQAGMCLDNNDQPVLATWWAPLTSSGNYSRQYMVAFPTASDTWATRQVSNRTVDPTTYIDTTGNYVRDLGRPAVVCDKEGRILVVYRDNHPPTTVSGSGGGITIAYSLSSAADPNRLTWTTLELTAANLGGYEPVVDLARWQSDNVLDLIYQPSQYAAHNGLSYVPPANTASQIGVLEWDEASYFAPPALNVALGAQDATLSWYSIPSSSYRLWTSTDLVNWTALSTVTGNGATQSYVHTGGATGPGRFWKLQVAEGSF